MSFKTIDSQKATIGTLAVATAMSLGGCRSKLTATTSGGTLQQKQATTESADPSAPTIDNISQPAVEIAAMGVLAAKPGEVVEVSGQNIRAGMTAIVNGVVVDLVVLNATKATFTMPTGAGIGLVDVSFKVDATDVKTLSLISDSAGDGLPISLDAAEHICNDRSFRNAKGEIKLGLRNCTGVSLANCTSDGEIGCATSAAFKAANIANFTDADVRSGVQVAGVTGSLTGAPVACAADGDTGCIANSSYRAAATVSLGNKILASNTVAGIAGNVTLPSEGNVLGSSGTYGVAGTGSTPSLTIPAAGNVLASAGAFGVAGTGTTPTLTLPAVGKVLASTAYGVSGTGSTGTLTLPAAGNVRTGTGTFGDPGAAVTPSYSPDFPAASVVLSGNTVNSAAGTLTLPPVGDVFTGVNYGISGTGSTGSLTLASASNVRTGQGAFGRSGTSITPTLADCSVDGGTACVAVAGFPAARVNAANLDISNIKRGVTIGGVLGAFPSASYPVPRYSDTGATTNTQADGGITTAFTTFTTQLTSAGSFEFWDSAGVRRTGSGDADIVNANIVSGVVFENFGLSGTAAVPAPWDVRIGTSVGATTGMLKTNCRNSVNPNVRATSNYQLVTNVDLGLDRFTIVSHGWANNTQIRITADTVPGGAVTLDSVSYYVCARNTDSFEIQTSATCAGSPIDLTSAGTNVRIFGWATGISNQWDTIEDYNNNRVITELQPTWSAATQCGGVGTATDDKVWTDVTTTGGGAPSNCTADAVRCTMKDKISGLQWSKQQSPSSQWGSAMAQCESLTYNGQSGWRLPTQKELMGAYNHGIYTAAAANWLTKAIMDGTYCWSSSSVSNNTLAAWTFNLRSGTTTNGGLKTGTYQVVCVRQ